LQTLQLEGAAGRFTEQVRPRELHTAPYSFPTGWQLPSAQSTRPLQLLSMPSLQISTAPPGQVVQVDGDPTLQAWPSESQVIPSQAGWPQVKQVTFATEQVFATGSHLRPNAQGAPALAQAGSWQSARPLQSLSKPSPQLTSVDSTVPPLPEQVVQVDGPGEPFTEQV